MGSLQYFLNPMFFISSVTNCQTMSSKRTFETLLAQYHECCEDIRNLDTLIWQIPSIAMAVNSFFGIAYLGYANTSEARIILLLASYAFNLVSIITLRKHRFQQIARTDDVVWIQKQLSNITTMRKLKWKTCEIIKDKANYPDVPRDGMIRLRAYRWLLGVLCLTVSIIMLLLLVETLTYFNCLRLF
jgi:hypothetical protein